MATKGWTAKHRFGSFAPIRNGSQAKWYVDGQDYMAAVADSIEAAEKEIFITDWQLNPHIFMKRPDSGVDSLLWRLDKMLLRKAEQGVRTYILLYWESKKIAGMDLGSEYAKTVLSHDNIEVLRHPDMTTLWLNPSTMFRWSHHEKVVVVDRSVAFVGGIDLCFGRWDTHSHLLTDPFPPHPCVLESDEYARIPQESTVQYSRWIGKDYGNTFLHGARTNLDEPMKDDVDRRKDPRMPWHDVACSVSGPPALDVATHFIQRYKYLKPHCGFQDILPNTELYQISDPSGRNLTIQVLRSVGEWSAGQPKETSIYNAYLHAIENAEHFVYIENQFFISSHGEVHNKVMLTLADRIYRAHQQSQDFRAMVIIPLKPEFPEKWDTDDNLRLVSYETYATIYRGEDCLMNRLKEKGIPSEAIPNYFSVYGLRRHGSLNGNLVTEIVYVHSKLMIVDDRVAIIGSANINDRSMLGDRDSEVAVIIQDNEMMEGKMNGRPYQVGKFSRSLRCHLLKEHLGLLSETTATSLNIKVEDPLTSSFHSTVLELAEENTRIFESVFRGRILPTNEVRNFDELKQWQSLSGVADHYLEQATKELDEIQGRIVLFPQLFLKDCLKPSSFMARVSEYFEMPMVGGTPTSTNEVWNYGVADYLVQAIKESHKTYRLQVVHRGAERDAGTSRAGRDAEPSRAERDPEPSRAERDPEPSCHECMERPLLSCVACHDLVEAIKEFHELKICNLRVVPLPAERDAGTSRVERDPEPSCHKCIEWPFLSCVACHHLVEAIKELHELDIYRLQVVRRRAERDAGLSRAERDPELSFHECMVWPLPSFVAVHDLVGTTEELRWIYRLPVVLCLAERDPEPSFDELKEWLRLVLNCWKL